MNDRMLVQRKQAAARTISTKQPHSSTPHSTLVAPFSAAPRTADTDLIAILAKNVRTGTYSMRVQTEGAESPLSTNQAGESYSQQVTILLKLKQLAATGEMQISVTSWQH